VSKTLLNERDLVGRARSEGVLAPDLSMPAARNALTALAGALAVSAAAYSIAASAGPQTAKIVGLGATTCLQFEDDVKQNAAAQRDYLAWAQGFMSGIILGRPPGIDQGLDLNPSTYPLLKQLEFLREHCVQHPAEDFSDAVEALYKRLRKEGAT
jgi:hypothetical protein